MIVRSKFFLMLSLIIIETVILSGMLYWMHRVEHAHTERINYAHSQWDSLLQISLNTNRQLKGVSDFLVQSDQREFSSLTKYEIQVQQSFDRLDRLTRDEVEFVDENEKAHEKMELKILKNLRKLYRKITDETEKALNIKREGKHEQAYKYFKDVVERIYVEEFSVLIEGQIRDERSEFYQAQASVERKNSHYRHFTAGFSILIALITILVAFQIIRNLSEQWSLITDSSKEIKKGQLGTNVAINSEDKIEQLVSTHNHMASDLQDSQQEIEAARDYLESILSSMVNTLFVISPQGHIQKVNRATEFLLGYTEEQLLNKPIETIFASEKGPLTQGSDIVKLIHNGECYAITQFYQKRDGTHLPMLTSGSVLYNQSGEAIGTILVAQDISTLKQS